MRFGGVRSRALHRILGHLIWLVNTQGKPDFANFPSKIEGKQGCVWYGMVEVAPGELPGLLPYPGGLGSLVRPLIPYPRVW